MQQMPNQWRHVWNACRALLGRLRPLVVFYVGGLIVFGGDRALFLLYNYDSVTMGPVRGGDILRCFRVGWFYDSAVLCYALLPAVLIWALVPRRWFSSRRFRSAVNVVGGICFAAMLFGCVSDLLFFRNFADRLNYLAFSYPVWRPEFLDMVWKNYPVGWAAALVILVGILCYMLFRQVGWPRKRPADEPRMLRPVVACGLAALLLVGIQGPPNPPDSNSSPSQFSRQHVINRAALNPVFTLTAAVRDELTDQTVKPNDYGFIDAGQAVHIAREAYARSGDVFADTPGVNPLVRTHYAEMPPSGQRPPNIVVIVMESLASEYVGQVGGEHDWTPELQSLAAGGVLFERLYAVGTRTSRGVVGTLSGVPDMPGRPISEQSYSRGRFLGLPSLLRDQGYRTMFIHGGDLGFNDVYGYLRRQGFETILQKKDFTPEELDRQNFQLLQPGEARFATLWSVDDQTMFRRGLREINASGEPFFATLLTLTNHPPYEVPHEVFDWTVRRDHPDLPAEMSEEQRAVRYSDWAVGDFFRRARREPWFDNTVFVLVADHCREQRPIFPVDVANFQIFAAILGPEELIGPPRHINAIASQADLAPTALARTGLPVTHCFMGRDLLSLSSSQDGFALLQQNGVVGFVSGDRAVCITPGEPGPAVTAFTIRGREQKWWNTSSPADAAELERLRIRGTALFQTAADLLQNRHYHTEPE